MYELGGSWSPSVGLLQNCDVVSGAPDNKLSKFLVAVGLDRSVCLSLCFSASLKLHVNTTDRILTKIITRDVSMHNEELIKFGSHPRLESRSRSRDFLKDSSTLQDRHSNFSATWLIGLSYL